MSNEVLARNENESNESWDARCVKAIDEWTK